MDADRIEELQEKFGLSYHIANLAQADRTVSFEGKTVLEVGGCLPRELVIDEVKAGRWIGIERLDYWDEQPTGDHEIIGTPPDRAQISGELANAPSPDTLPEHCLLTGSAEDIPDSFDQNIDVVFSIATFEHLLNLPEILRRLHRCLKPGGELFTLFSPIWPAHDGHHLPSIEDQQGNVFDFYSDAIPRWGHLTLRPPGMYKHLLKHADAVTAGRMVYYIYHSPHINRLFAEDYIKFVSLSPFSVVSMGLIFPTEIPDEMKALLVKLYLHHNDFSYNGMLIHLRRDD